MEAPYEQKPNESARAYAAFTSYANLGRQRSLAAVAAALGNSDTLMKRWSRQYDWVERARAYDARLAAVEREAAEEQLRAKEAEGARRKGELLEQEWAMHHDCMRAAREALKRFHEHAERGATLGEIARLIEVASKLGRLATGMATDRTEVTGQEGGPMQLELSVALKKVYGEILTSTRDRRSEPAVEDPQILLLPRGDCTDPQPPKKVEG